MAQGKSIVDKAAESIKNTSVEREDVGGNAISPYAFLLEERALSSVTLKKGASMASILQQVTELNMKGIGTP